MGEGDNGDGGDGGESCEHHCTTPATALCRVTGGVPGTRSDSFSDLQIAMGPSEMFIMEIAKYSILVEA